MSELTATQPAAAACHPSVNRIPLSTYRLQLGPDLTIDQARTLLPYLEKLGITDLYLSPLFRARAESSHGYDVVDHGTIDPAIGDVAAFARLAEGARAAGMGILLDIVPNHMGINDSSNAWWLDVLENGKGSCFADYFDIEWNPPANALQDKILLPFLGQPFGQVLENGELRVVYRERRLQLEYGSRRFPLAPPSWPLVLELALAERAESIEANSAAVSEWNELESIITQLRNLPPGSRRDPEATTLRYREQKIAAARLEELLRTSAAVRDAFGAALHQINGEQGDPKCFDRLDKLLDEQWYRLAYWRVASDEINYRRFFDVNDLAAIRVEDPRVFDAVHRLAARLLEAGYVTGIRVDHPDGLRDPLNYFQSLQSLYRSAQPSEDNSAPNVYVVAEKILSGDESLPSDWAVCGTTGYDFLNLIGRLQVHAEGLAEIRSAYDRIIKNSDKPADVVYASRRAVLSSTMASELQMLAAQLSRIAQQHRSSRDFTQPALLRALREVLANMTVYRTYARGDSWDISDADYRAITSAVRMAKRRNRTFPHSVFDFIASVLLLEHPPTLSAEQANERRHFALKFQQVSGPIAAKGVEDTAFYRYYPLASLNEVGGELDARPLAADEFHRLMRHRSDSWPHSLSATSTHDSKRGEDLRARLQVLSELPQEWAAMVIRWQEMTQQFLGEHDGGPVPDANEEYLIYQTLVGTWSTGTMSSPERDEYLNRILRYFDKALREAKLHTSWMNPSETYETAVKDFIRALLNDVVFTTDLASFVAKIADAGFVNSLAQLLLKLTLPGVPDFYRGTELWDFNLVDPDNRRPVDYDSRRKRLNEISKTAENNPFEFARELASRWPSSDVKVWVTSAGLQLRRLLPDVFTCGEYVPLTVAGTAADHIFAFARRYEEQVAVTVAPLHFYRLSLKQRAPQSATKNREKGPPRVNWADTKLVLPDDFPHDWQCHLTGQKLSTATSGGPPALEVAQLLDVLPVALLIPRLD
jgi:(1->4)-alpha-D-glucan 1-alpha-D-glucosylmutase